MPYYEILKFVALAQYLIKNRVFFYPIFCLDYYLQAFVLQEPHIFVEEFCLFWVLFFVLLVVFFVSIFYSFLKNILEKIKNFSFFSTYYFKLLILVWAKFAG